MNPVQEYAVKHPQVIGLFFAFLAGYCAYNAYQGGIAVQFLRGDTARTASEALGG